MTDSQERKTVFLIGGPTAVGKSDIAFELAKKINGEIVNCDSVQLYKEMEIGSAMPSKEEMAEIPHHLYGIIDPGYNITVAEYQQLAFEAIDDIISRGKTPVVVGGTGLYMNSIMFNMDFASKPGDPERRAELEKLAEERGSEYVYEVLTAIDPDSASRIHPNNTRKIIRAIEAFELGSNIRNLDECELNDEYDFKLFGINMDREYLYDRINRRVIELIRLGLLDEVAALYQKGYDIDTPSMQAIGYKEILNYFHGEVDIKTAIESVMKNTRHYAKRQITWLKRYKDLTWVMVEKDEPAEHAADRILEMSGYEIPVAEEVDNGEEDI